MSDKLKPNPALLIKLGSIIVHFDEFLGPGSHELDLMAARSLMSDPEVKQWLEDMTKDAFLPVKRS